MGPDPSHQHRFAIRVVICCCHVTRRCEPETQTRTHPPQKGIQSLDGTCLVGGSDAAGYDSAARAVVGPEVVKLYRARWQIELFFKRLKQGLLLHWVPVKPWKRAQTYVHLCVIVWWLQEQNAQDLGEMLAGS